VKILFVTNARLCNGAEEHLIDLAHFLLSTGVNLRFAILESSPFAERLQREKLPFANTFTATGKKIRSIINLARLIAAEQPDVVSVNREHNIYLTWLAVLLAAPFCRRRPKLAMIFHTPTGKRYPFLGWFDGIVATSRYTADSFITANPELAGKITIIHYGIHLPPPPDEAKANPDRERHFLKEYRYPLIGMVGELWKNQSELIPLAQILIHKLPNLTVAIVGGETEASFSALRQLIVENGLEKHFALIPRVPRTRIPDVFYDFDVSVSTHRNEGFGIVHIESLAAMTPLVAYNCGGIREIISNGGGILVDGGTAELAETLLRVLTDAKFRQTVGMEGRKIVEEQFTIEIMCRKHYDFYASLVNS
jgi:glycosyltransferase involved in cell wall biosynthesis